MGFDRQPLDIIITATQGIVDNVTCYNGKQCENNR